MFLKDRKMEKRKLGRHREWRKIAKRERRRRLRRIAAIEREAEVAKLQKVLERSNEYLEWTKKQEEEEKLKEIREKQEHEEREKLWLEEEAKAQKNWQVAQEEKAKALQQQIEQQELLRKEFEAKQEIIRKKQEEEQCKREEEFKRRERLQKEINDYIDDGVKTPEVLREVTDSQPGKELCPFFTKTGACRYGEACSRNHRRVCLSKIILVPGFYSHFSLEKNSAEYDTDVGLEYENSETRRHYLEFYEDVVPELESFGRIKVLKCCKNAEIHLRGNVYVEYYCERDAARAIRKLRGRWYAGKRLNCEFANLASWRAAICGMSKCPKGRACNFLHTFRNPRDEYDARSPPRRARNEQEINNKKFDRRKSKWEESPRKEDDEREWRWSESPEPRIKNSSNGEHHRLRYSQCRKKESKKHRDRSRESHEASERSHRSKKRKRESSSKRHRDANNTKSKKREKSVDCIDSDSDSTKMSNAKDKNAKEPI